MNLVSMIWSLAATVLAGVFVLIVLVVPQLGGMMHVGEGMMIALAALLGCVVAVPIAVKVTKAISVHQ